MMDISRATYTDSQKYLNLGGQGYATQVSNGACVCLHLDLQSLFYVANFVNQTKLAI